MHTQHTSNLAARAALPHHGLQHNGHYRRLRRQLRRVRGAGYAVVAAAALAAAGLQPPHTGDVEVGTLMVATGAGGDFTTWTDAKSLGR